MEVMHFKTQKERLDYLKGNFEEIVAKEVSVPKEAETPLKDATDSVEEVKAEAVEVEPIAKPKRKKSSKKKGKKDDAVQAE